MAERVFLAEADAYDPDAAQLNTHYFSSASITPFAPGDADRSNQFYDPRLIDPANYSRAVFAERRTSERTQVNAGVIEIANADGEYDFLLDDGLDGRTLRILVGTEGDAWNQYTTLLLGTMEQPVHTFSKDQPARIQIRIRDRRAEMDVPIQPAKFDGSNVGATGIEGTPDDLEGRPKPQTWGKVENVTPAPANTSKLIYGVNWDEVGNTKAVSSFDQVRDNGVALTFSGTDHATLTALQGATITAGEFDTALALGLFRLGGSPAGAVTCDVTEGTAASDRTAAQVAKRIMEGPGGLVAGDLDSQSFTDLDTANSAIVGIYIDSERDISRALDDVLNSIGASWIVTNLGKFHVQRLEAPSGAALITFTDAELIEIERVSARDEGKGLPAFRVNMNYRKNWTVQTAGELAGSVSDADRAKWVQEWRGVTATDATIQTTHLLAVEINKDTLLTAEADADTEAIRVRDLFKVRRDLLRIAVESNTDTDPLELLDVVQIKLARFGYGAGKDFRILGLAQNEPRNGQITLELWG